MARDTRLSIGKMYNILKDQPMRAYYIALYQALTPEDAQNRFCNWVQRAIGEN